jgi:hypothetical protein
MPIITQIEKWKHGTIAERFWPKVDQRQNHECWPWKAYITTAGYGQLSLGRVAEGSQVAHRIMYELCNGPIPDGKHIDHLCRNRWCVNPQHLQAVTRRMNLLRGLHQNAVTHRLGVCLRGHEANEINTYRRKSNGRRQCRICARERRAAERQRRKR